MAQAPQATLTSLGGVLLRDLTVLGSVQAGPSAGGNRAGDGCPGRLLVAARRVAAGPRGVHATVVP